MAEEADSAPPSSPPAPSSPMQSIVENFNKLEPRQKMAGAVVLALAIALVVGVWLWSQKPEYSVLFSNIDEKDGGAIIAALTQQNVPYRVENGGAAILVPAQRANELRLTLANQGLPKGGSVGFELMENEKLGLSQFHEQVNYQRALEGELARTIQSIDSIAAARVHLAIPKQTAFLRNEQKPTASVVVSLRPGRKLENIQIAGIVHLIASSVPEMAADQVSLIDQNGNLLAHQRKGPALDETQLEYVQSIEEGYIARIQKILEPVLGTKNFRAQVTADVDFDDTEMTSESYKPNPNPNTAIRSQQTAESTSNNPGAIGVPGALSNQPPVPASAPLTSPAIVSTPQSGTSSSTPLNSSKTATTNYELDKTVQHVKRSLGQVRRLSVAVVVNNKAEKNPKDGSIKSVALTEDEVKKINDVVREAVGYDDKRGDTINVTNTAFTDPVTEDIPHLPFYKDPDILAMIKEGARWLVLALVLLLVYRKVILPLVHTVSPPPPEPEPEEESEPMLSATGEPLEEEEESIENDIPPEILELELAKMSYEKKLARARELARKDPKAVAQLIKEWIGGSSGEGR
jgi:flagellar M-ring protein FliF